MSYRVTLWFEEDNLVVSFDHPFYGETVEEDPQRDDTFDTTDMDSRDAGGILEYMYQSDSWSGLFYDHDHITRVKVEKV